VRRIVVPDGPLRVALVTGGWIAILIGLSLAVWGLVTFFRARTAVMPDRGARRLVVEGPYRISRNPMYVGLSALYLGLGMLFNVAWPIVLFPLALLALDRLVIRREERYLLDAFGAEYAAYCRRVRRWL
jgi:protein-S-isoprenylcysteine O-methyltransferase Ste14